jgi:hypothetical protein
MDATVTVPPGTGLDVAFRNQNNQWDNNNGADYHIGAFMK